jgi:hypothetical protein
MLLLKSKKIERQKIKKKQHFDDNNDFHEGENNTDPQVDIDFSETQTVHHSDSKAQSRSNYLPDHPEYMSHTLRIRTPTKRFVPVPIGPSIPRRDREAVRERYCRLMLIFFKPWRHAQDLRRSNESWSNTFEEYLKHCSPDTIKLIKNSSFYMNAKTVEMSILLIDVPVHVNNQIKILMYNHVLA